MVTGIVRFCTTSLGAPRRPVLTFTFCCILAWFGLAPEPSRSGDADDPLQGLASSAGLRATVFGPDPENLADLPRHIPLREYNLDIEGALPVPDLFWFNRRLRIWFSPQQGPAPLVVVVAGTGSDGNAGSVQVLRAALYGAGYHVLTMPSPTFPGFIVAASSTGVAGDLTQDAADLSRALRQSMARLPATVEITGLHMVGYSLGGAHAAVVKAHDTGPDPIGIQRVVMINPTVNLFQSVGRLDRMFDACIGNDSNEIERFYQRLYSELALVYRDADAFALNEAFLLEAASRLLKTDMEFCAAIALSFRMALINMFFAGDYYARTGVVVDPASPPHVGEPLDAYLLQLRTKSFSEYFERVFAPFYLARRPGWTRTSLIAANSLDLVAETLAENADIYAQHNSDDLILDAQELAWLRSTLGPRLKVYSRGGHLGNIGEQQQIDDMLSMLAGHWDAAAENVR